MTKKLADETFDAFMVKISPDMLKQHGIPKTLWETYCCPCALIVEQDHIYVQVSSTSKDNYIEPWAGNNWYPLGYVLEKALINDLSDFYLLQSFVAKFHKAIMCNKS